MMFQLRSYQSFSWDLGFDLFRFWCLLSGGIIATKKVPVGDLSWFF